MSVEIKHCEIVQGARVIARRQGLPVEAVICPQAAACDLKEPCPTSPVEVFNARLDRTRSLLDAKISGQYFSNGDKI